MKTIKWSLVLITLFAAPAVWAEEEAREDPWEYDKDKESKREESEKADKESERTFGASGDFVISAERVLGFAASSSKIKLDGPDQKESVTRFNFLTNANQSSVGEAGLSVPAGYSAPRLAFDYFLADAISIGIAIGYSSATNSEKNGYFIASPRVGYAFMFNETFGIWPRLGGTYIDQKINGSKLGVIAISAELPVVITPMEHVAFTIGPSFDGGLYGKINPDGPQGQTDFAMDEFGVHAALSAFF
jgi:hypothetical protein